MAAQFGVMFFPDMHTAYAEARRVLRPGGRFVFNVWDRLERNALTDILYGVVDELFPMLPVPKPPIPFSYHDPAVIEAHLRRAGFVGVQFKPVAGVSRATSAHDAAVALCQGQNVGLKIDALGPGNLDAAMNAVRERIAARFGYGRIEAPNLALMVTARRPSG
jgi:hypothetical protein